jgi:DHA2 family multidrug resistance protein-like MFS transporter
MRTFGQCLGAALVGVLLAAMASGSHIALEAQAVKMSLWVAVATSGLAILFSLSRLRRKQPQNAQA